MPDDATAEAFRRWGYLQADLDPLGRLAPFPHPDLDDAPPEAAARWRPLYCGAIGAEFMHLPYPERCHFVAARMEAPIPASDPERILRRLAEAELFERFLHARYVGTKRYSLEGAAALLPLLDGLLEGAAEAGVEIVLLAMSHRGRLNVMAHIAGVKPSDLFAGFEDLDPRSILGSGDVKYHLGATGEYTTASDRTLQVHVVSNPSHLEAVDPVILGRTRARQERLGPEGARRVLAITLHGDAAFAGQGIAAEALNLAGLRGFTVGGSIHVVVNNLIGFTAQPEALHTSRFASDVARRVPIPILHVGGHDPEAAERAGRLASDYRSEFATDVVVDLIGYRRYGHSEVEDPTTTQPLLYRRIATLPMLWQQYGARLGRPPESLQALEAEIGERLQAELERGRSLERKPTLRTLPRHWDAYVGGRYDPALEVETAVPAARLEEIATRLAATPAGFHVHPKVRRLYDQRLEMGAGTRPIDWGMAEALAFGSLLWDGMLVRLAGQDSRRGTFNQRHAALFDSESGAEHVPLRHLHPGQGRFDPYDTCLSEAAALGFEYGFSRDYPDALVLWEAQFGDFANGAQVIIDQFLAAGEDKWGLLSGLTLLLPHGYEGQGPEHSSARVERYLELAAEDNLQVCQPTSAAQYFHLLRRQALRRWRKPLIVMTPKGMLRAAAAASPREDLEVGSFHPLLLDGDPAAAGRLLLCTGKIALDLLAERDRRGEAAVAIARLEQLYPFPEGIVSALLDRLPAVAEIVWVQEEPANMGALRFVRPLLQRLAGGRPLTTVKRSASASPATGSAKAHAIEQAALFSLAFARTGSS
jgi:2-oxoglutarate dehydrogenase E1 component